MFVIVSSLLLALAMTVCFQASRDIIDVGEQWLHSDLSVHNDSHLIFKAESDNCMEEAHLVVYLGFNCFFLIYMSWLKLRVK